MVNQFTLDVATNYHSPYCHINMPASLPIPVAAISILAVLQVEDLEAAVDSKDAELITLRKTLEHKEAQVCTALLWALLCASFQINVC